ncbi:MAG: hypothetical protein ABI577_17405, partial [bacterium]
QMRPLPFARDTEAGKRGDGLNPNSNRTGPPFGSSPLVSRRDGHQRLLFAIILKRRSNRREA